MENIKFEVDGYLEGGFPLEEEDIETIIELDYYDQLIKLINEKHYTHKKIWDEKKTLPQWQKKRMWMFVRR